MESVAGTDIRFTLAESLNVLVDNSRDCLFAGVGGVAGVTSVSTSCCGLRYSTGCCHRGILFAFKKDVMVVRIAFFGRNSFIPCTF